MHLTRVMAVACLLTFSSAGGQAQGPATAGDRYLILTVSKTFQKEIAQAVAAGYRVVDGDAAQDVLLLEKRADPGAREYQVLSVLQNQLEKASKEGFRVMPSTLSANDLAGAVVERDPAAKSRHVYLIVDAGRTATLEKEIVEAAGKGYSVVGMTSGANEHVALLERPEESSGPVDGAARVDQFKLLATNKSSTLQQELSAQAAQGYRVLFASAAKEALVLLEKPAVPSTAEYLVVAAQKTTTLQQEFNAAAGKGYRMLPRTLVALQQRAGMLGAYGYEVGAIMEKGKESGPGVEYLVLGAKRLSTLSKELSDAAAKGFSVLRMISAYQEAVIVLERPAAGSTP